MENGPDEEEILVFAEFDEPINFDKYNNIHVLGIETKNPIFQLDDTFYTGTFENPLGTYMFFDEDPSPKSSDPLFDKLPDKSLKFLCKTRKLIKVEHAYITPKEGKQGHEHPEVQKAKCDNIQLPDFKSIQDALEKFKKEWNSEAVDINEKLEPV